MSIISMTGVNKVYPPRQRGQSEVVALDGIDLTVNKGDIFGIIGYSGAGKSTLVRLVNALETASGGSIVVDGTELVGLRESELRRVRLGIGMIFQQFNLFSAKTVWGNIAYPLTVAGVSREKQTARISELLHFVGLADKAHSYPDELSGGQKQRVGIARALATSPGILLADEATSALDPETTDEVLTLLQRVNREYGVTIIVITHEMEVIKRIANHVAVMEAGRIIESGPVFEVFSHPQTAASKRFVNTVVNSAPRDKELAALVERHPGTIISVAVNDTDASQSEVIRHLIQREVEFELIHGGIDNIQGKTFGTLTFALRGTSDNVRAAIDAVSRFANVEEVA
ncbi:methionine ABC transporter ATP-binding protein [Klugiella xanthotipulae]|uniref:D-methionine transport system ATP-binding protein n=1 Tax=Klugiella xanthotipulae TaxID=244735 RepID=A0A543HS23_9MICO|nr:methionine ABC transporter ATP-binding protein [Klugiella xanthotipulae]TQM61147.1 D-methionine transport system ATP-binding protein [Klugiella xanthotipulae]